MLERFAIRLAQGFMSIGYWGLVLFDKNAVILEVVEAGVVGHAWSAIQVLLKRHHSISVIISSRLLQLIGRSGVGILHHLSARHYQPVVDVVLQHVRHRNLWRADNRQLVLTSNIEKPFTGHV